MNYIDLTRTFNQSLPVYPGDPRPSVKTVNTVESDGFTWCEVTSGMHVGTHLDAPLHFLSNGVTIDKIPVNKFFGKGVFINAYKTDCIDEKLLSAVTLEKGSIVLIYTGWEEKFNSPEYFSEYPDISEGFAQRLIEAGISMVGTDTASPDHDPFTIHKMLLGNDILIIENLINLDKLKDIDSFNVCSLPAKYETEAAPVRVIVSF